MQKKKPSCLGIAAFFYRFFLLVVLSLLPQFVSAGNPSDTFNRPKIGLVLSGGGARGAAHIGVIKVLEELQIPIDCIAGTSMGSIVGGLYASGMTIPVSDINFFDYFIIPYRAVATDIVPGEAVILDPGDLAMSMRAGMSVPAVFSAVEIDGRLLVDGGVSNNLPVDVARDMCADEVIVVDISTPLLKREELSSVLSITEQLTGILTRRNTEAQIATLTYLLS